MRFLADDLPVIQEALNLYVGTLKRSSDIQNLQAGGANEAADMVLDALEKAERLLARARVELANVRAREQQVMTSPVPGVSL